MPFVAPAPLTADHDLRAFDCGVPALDDWLKRRALRNESRYSRTFVLCDGDQVIAFYSLAAGAVQRAEMPAGMRRNAPESVPVTIIARLAVDTTVARRGFGSDLLADALRRIAIASRTIGMRAVLVHAKDDAAQRFYLSRAEFIEYPADSRTLFLPIETIVAALD